MKRATPRALNWSAAQEQRWLQARERATEARRLLRPLEDLIDKLDAQRAFLMEQRRPLLKRLASAEAQSSRLFLQARHNKA